MPVLRRLALVPKRQAASDPLFVEAGAV